MRWTGGIFAALLAVAFLSAALLYGANWYLRDGGGQIGEVLRRYAPGMDVRFARAGLRLGFGAASFYAEDLFLRHGEGAQIHSPRAEFWVDADGVSALFHRPEIIVQNTKDGAIPIVGKWAAEARNAKIILQNENGVSLTLQNALLRARGEEGKLQASVLAANEERELRAAAELEIDSDGVRGAAELAVKNFPPGDLPLQWRAMQLTVRAQIENSEVQFIAAGNLDLTAAVEWRAAGRWDGDAASLTINAAAEKWIPIANTPSVDAFVRGVLQYEKGGWDWRGDVVAAGADGVWGGEVLARGDQTKVANGEVDLQIANASANQMWKYVPHEEAREWLSESLTEGDIVAARLRARGISDSFADADVVLAAVFVNGRIGIGEGWPDAERLGGVLRIQNGDIVVDGEGGIGGAFASTVRAYIPAADATTPATLYLQTKFDRASLAEYFAAAKLLPPARAEVESVLRRLQFGGDGKLLLSVQVPLATPQDSSFAAQLAVLGNGEIGVANLPPLSGLFGEVQIDGDGVRTTLHGKLAGAAVRVAAKNEEIRIRGTIPAAVALSVAAVDDVPASGAAKFRLHRDARRTIFISDLRGVSFAFPPPLAKSKNETASLYIKTEQNDTRASLHFRGDTFSLQTKNGGADIAINEPLRAPPKNGVYIHGRIRGANGMADWIAQGGENDTALSLALSDLEIWNMPKQNLTVRAPFAAADGTRNIALDGGAIDGTVSYRPGVARAALSRLHLAGPPNGGGSPDIRGLSLTAAIRDLQIGEVALGSLALQGAPFANGWRLESLRLENGENELSANGFYDGLRTALSVQLSAPQAAAALSVFGQSNVVSEGGATLAGGVEWQGAPPDFSLDSAAGNVSLLAENLRYLKSEQNVIGLLAVLSPQSLLQLGFTELGKEGVRIDSMRGEIGLQNGFAEFRDVVMENDDLSISLRGKTDLRARTLDISGRVRPGNRLLKAGSAAGIGAVAAVQPIALAAGWFLGKVFEKPISEIGAYNYTVTGEWSDPIYAEISNAAVVNGGQ